MDSPALFRRLIPYLSHAHLVISLHLPLCHLPPSTSLSLLLPKQSKAMLHHFFYLWPTLATPFLHLASADCRLSYLLLCVNCTFMLSVQTPVLIMSEVWRAQVIYLSGGRWVVRMLLNHAIATQIDGLAAVVGDSVYNVRIRQRLFFDIFGVRVGGLSIHSRLTLVTPGSCPTCGLTLCGTTFAGPIPPIFHPVILSLGFRTKKKKSRQCSN